MWEQICGVCFVPVVVSISIFASPPVRVTRASSRNSKVPPVMVISSAAALSGLPTSRFPMRSERVSAAPPVGTPIDAKPGRPRSWTVVSMPGLMTRRERILFWLL